MDNDQALGYMLLACKELNLDKKMAKDLLKEMMYQFDVKIESEAKERGFKWLYEEE